MHKKSSLACETCPAKDSAACKVLTTKERANLAKIGYHIEAKRGALYFMQAIQMINVRH